MSRETLEIRDEEPAGGLARPQKHDGRGDREALAARLASVERAYDELLARVRWYEEERRRMKQRLERLLVALGSPSSETVDPA